MKQEMPVNPPLIRHNGSLVCANFVDKMNMDEVKARKQWKTGEEGEEGDSRRS